MQVIEFYNIKKMCHYLMEEKYRGKEILFAVPDLVNLKIFETIFDFLKKKYNQSGMQLGIVETIKQREKSPKYTFINLMNVEELRRYELIFKVPEIYDYAYFLPEVVGLSNIPDIKIDETFNYVLSYYGIETFVVVHIDNKKDISKSVEYIEYLYKNNTKTILIGNPIYCAEIANLTDVNPIIIYKKNIPLVVDLLKKCNLCVGNTKPNIQDVKYNYATLDNECRKLNQ